MLPSLPQAWRRLPRYRDGAQYMRDPRDFARYVALVATASFGFLYPPVVEATGVTYAQNAAIAAAHIGATAFKLVAGYRSRLVTLINPLFWVAVTLVEPAAMALAWLMYVLSAAQDGVTIRPSAWYAALLLCLPGAVWAAGGRFGFAHGSVADALLTGAAAAFAYAWLSAEVFRYTGLIGDSKRADAQRIRNDVRERIAADLHDGLGATFTGMTLRCRVAAASPPAAARPMIEEVFAMTNKALRKIRVLAKSFGPEELTADELEGMVREQLNETAPGMAVFHTEGAPPPKVDHEFVYHLLHIIGEATVNAVRHGRARRIAVTLAWNGPVWHLAVEDDGRGLGPAEADFLQRSSALANRAQRMGARMRAAPRAPGARVEVTNAVAELT